MTESILLASIVATYALVQSIFGVGLLVFGTPTLLLLGFPFLTVLATLLPASLAVSLAQTIEGRARCAIRPAFLYCSVPAIAIGLGLVLTGAVRPRMGVIVGAMLLATAGMRFSPALRSRLEGVIRRHFALGAMVTGLIHGLSNLGGGPLTIIMATLHNDRESMRTNIACAYLVFSAIQLTVLAVLSPAAISARMLPFPIVALAMHAMVGNRIFRWSSEPTYNRLLTAFTFCFGLALFARELM